MSRDYGNPISRIYHNIFYAKNKVICEMVDQVHPATGFGLLRGGETRAGGSHDGEDKAHGNDEAHANDEAQGAPAPHCAAAGRV